MVLIHNQTGMGWRTWTVLAGLAVCLLGTAREAEAARPVTFKVILIEASDKPAPLDRRLDRVEYRLRRIFGFEHYRFLGEASQQTGLPATFRLSPGQGYTLDIEARRGSDGIRTKVVWRKGGQAILSTTLVLHKGNPSVLGGPRHNGGTIIVSLSVE